VDAFSEMFWIDPLVDVNLKRQEVSVYVPETYRAALILMLTSMVCWGSWPNLLKKLPKWRLEYFYFDYTLGFVITAVIYGVTLGPAGTGESGFFGALLQAGHREALLAIAGGFIWNIGNILLLNSIMIAGLAVAFRACKFNCVTGQRLVLSNEEASDDREEQQGGSVAR
jgi:glucose uptake protein GlcU